MVIWTGFGIVVPVIALATLVMVQLGIDGIMGDNYYTTHGWPKLLGCVLTGIVMYPIGYLMNRPKEKVVGEHFDQQTIVVKPNHTFFFVPVQYWSVIIIAFGIYMSVA